MSMFDSMTSQQKLDKLYQLNKKGKLTKNKKMLTNDEIERVFELNDYDLEKTIYELGHLQNELEYKQDLENLKQKTILPQCTVICSSNNINISNIIKVLNNKTNNLFKICELVTINENNGVTKKGFQKMIKNNEFILYNNNNNSNDKCYGVSIKNIKTINNDGLICILNIDVDIALALNDKINSIDCDYIGIFNTQDLNSIKKKDLFEEIINYDDNNCEDTLFNTFNKWYPFRIMKTMVICYYDGIGYKKMIQTLKTNNDNDICTYCTSNESINNNKNDIKYIHVGTKTKFKESINNNEFVFYYENNDEYYGIKKYHIEQIKANKKVPIIFIKHTNIETLKNNKQFNGYFVFINVTNGAQTIRNRLIKQGYSTEQINVKLKDIHKYFQFYQTNNAIFDDVLQNDNIDDGIKNLTKMVTKLYPQSYNTTTDMDDNKED